MPGEQKNASGLVSFPKKEVPHAPDDKTSSPEEG